jgi:hypothetical protein
MEKMDRPLHRLGPIHAEGILGRIGESLSSPPPANLSLALKQMGKSMTLTCDTPC